LEGKEPEKVGKNNPYLVIIVQGRAGGMFGDETEKGKTQYKNLPNGYNNSDDGLTLVKVFPLKLKPTIVIFSGSDDELVELDLNAIRKKKLTEQGMCKTHDVSS
jgi:hypothetical protein